MRHRVPNGDHRVEIAQMRLQFYRISAAVKAVVPHEMWSAIAERLGEPPQQHPDALNAEAVD